MSSKTTNLSPKLIIQQIRVAGDRFIALELQTRKGLNVIRGENSSGRTTLLKLFEFGLGANVSPMKFFIPEIQRCKRLLLEVVLNDITYTFEREFGRGSNQVKVYKGHMDAPLHDSPSYLGIGGEFSDFLLLKLGIPRISFVDPYYEREKKITFSDVYDMLYLDQERGFSEIHARIRGKDKRKHIFKLLTKIINPDLYEIEIEEKSLKKKEIELKEAFQSVSRFLGSVDLPTSIEIQTEIDRLRVERVEFDVQLKNLKQRIRSNPAYINPLRDEILKLENDVAEKRKSLSFMQQTLNSYAELDNQLYEDLDRAARVRISAKQLASFEFEKCPRCLQEITIDMKRGERTGRCSLCGRPLVKTSEQVDELENYELQIHTQLDELHELKDYYQNQISEVEYDHTILEAELSSKRQALDEVIEEFVSPLIQQVEFLGYSIASIDEEIHRYDQLHRWRVRLQEMEEEFHQVSLEIKKLQERKEKLIEQENAMQAKLSNLETFFYQFIRDTYPDFKDAKIDYDSFLPVINSCAYNAKSATQRDIAILGYYYALLRFSIENESYIPRFLAIDTLRQDDLSSDLYEAVLGKFKELEDRYDGDFQLFLVVREPTDFLRSNEILQLVGGQRLLKGI